MTHTSDKPVTDEELELVTRGKAAGIYMKAPNGSPTSLNERQWVQVRTRAFKNSFGDWENVPEAASRLSLIHISGYRKKSSPIILKAEIEVSALLFATDCL